MSHLVLHTHQYSCQRLYDPLGRHSAREAEGAAGMAAGAAGARRRGVPPASEGHTTHHAHHTPVTTRASPSAHSPQSSSNKYRRVQTTHIAAAGDLIDSIDLSFDHVGEHAGIRNYLGPESLFVQIGLAMNVERRMRLLVWRSVSTCAMEIGIKRDVSTTNRHSCSKCICRLLATHVDICWYWPTITRKSNGKVTNQEGEKQQPPPGCLS